MKVTRKIIKIDESKCDGCGSCVPSCAEGAIQIVDGKARLVADKYCDGLGACLGECPNDALIITERDADEFDEHEVEKHLKAKEQEKKAQPAAAMPCGCASTHLQTLIAPISTQEADQPGSHHHKHHQHKHHEHKHHDQHETDSNLANWPIKLNLVPPTAPFLRGASLLVLSDCVPVAYPQLNHDLLKGRVVLMGCPKFDNIPGYVEKFTEMFQTAGIKDVTVAVMEVPCCSGMPAIVKKGMTAADKDIPMEVVVVSPRGKVVGREKID
ncbi:MAG: 4Fe-4S binding protein [Deltaproteobacteria bacterium]|nr:4Fe-4S binding protein [Deltaproteobacteria bacterium]